ncbi:NADH-quinone oxidoreductase subunit D [Methanoplanus sp. FWC-SCC4]|uniref:NADH-quinone oxidoreductase subunit D n=1 Tax=Methanochimaera problematica TaxID=2609417 RepID=A0AA97FB08_9EURY|nr:nickel-dependent hydrogenase large subunit [Methanoplanus sp. FWC-SCC4]WOF15802.1 NADH-quinone oxidoreductase subunit D [Methanoplanus sp. FWC-SCC4]
MSRRVVVPFGPQHPVLPEPIHLDLVLEDEHVVEAIPSIGYVHRGLEKLVEIREYKDYVFIAERICGICSFIHSLAYCQGIENIMDVDVPPRAHYLRTIWSEYSRMHSHLLWMGLFADSMGFENLFMNSWRLREKVLDAMEETTGGRVIQSSCKVGGVRKDISDSKLKEMILDLEKMAPEIEELNNVFFDESTVKHRTKGIGMLSKEEAYDLGAVGPTARGSGIAIDIRDTGYAAYGDLDFKPVTENGCDCYSRCMVRAKEVLQSIDLIKQAAENIPSGDIEIKVKGNPDGEYFSRVEQPRGECVHYIKGNGKKFIQRERVRTPTLTNIPPLVKMLAGCEMADVPVIVLSIDPCIGCAER